MFINGSQRTGERGDNMERIMSLRWLVSLFALFLIFAANAVAEPPADHTADEHGIMHAEDKDYPGHSHCTDCHGSDIMGGIGPSCYSCHGAFWRYFNPALVTPPLDHTIVRNGVKHKPGHLDPLNSGCTLCHGENLDDGFAPSCFTCHEELWGGEGPPADHTELKGVIEAAHKPGFGTPFATGCTDCHGPNLNDGFAPSCYTCHPRIWAGEGPPEDHTETMLGFADHKPGFWQPITSECTQCHGPNLNDGFGTACSDCHGPVWDGTDGHHMPGRDEPWTWCTTCHGDELLGETFGEVDTPACVSCHNDFSPPDPPGPGHNKDFPSFDHSGFDIDDRLDPYTKCATCHGDPDTVVGGFPPGCQTCHGQLWDEQNLPPDVDTGGPYQGIVDQPVTFDASGTTDPELDTLLYQWDFGDGSPVTSVSEDPTATHTYTQAGTYNAQLTVSDSVNDPVAVDFVVNVSEDGSDGWTVTTTTQPPETFGITFTDNSGSLVGVRDDGGLAVGMEFPGVIFWMDVTLGQLWDGGDIYFGNIDRPAGTMVGIVFEGDGGIATFTGTQN